MDQTALNYRSTRERDAQSRQTTNAGHPVPIQITDMRFNSVQDSGDRSGETSSSQYYSPAISPPPMPAELQHHPYTAADFNESPSPSVRSTAGKPRSAKLSRNPRGEVGVARRVDPDAADAAASQVQHGEPTLASLITNDTGQPLYIEAGMRSYSGGQRLKSASASGFYSEPASSAVSPVIFAPQPFSSGWNAGDPRSASVDVTNQLQIQHQQHHQQRSSRGLGTENEQLLMSPQRMGPMSQRQSMYSDEFPDSSNHSNSRQPNNPSPNATSISAQSMTGASTAFSFQNSQRSQSQMQSQSLTLATNRSSTSNSNHNTAIGGSRDSMFLRLKEKMKAFKPKSRPQSDNLSDNKAVFFAGNGSSLGPPTTAMNSKPYLGTSNQASANTLFGMALARATMIAGVPIGCVAETGEPCIVPTVVAICGRHLRENGQQTQGIFRVNGSMKRVQKLQDEFNTPPEYGRHVGWDGYTLHDAATLLRRYLNSLPEPVISTDFYDDFRNLLIENIPHNDKLHMYASLISQLPAESRHTLLYVLELLALFAKPENAKLTLMTSSNLAAVLQPCLLVHPGHVADPQEYVRSKAVIEFLIVNAAKIRGPESELSAAGDSESGTAGLIIFNTDDAQGADVERRDLSAMASATDSVTYQGAPHNSLSYTSESGMAAVQSTLSVVQPNMQMGESQATGGMTAVAGSALYLTNTEPMPSHHSQQHAQLRGISEQSSATTMSQQYRQHSFVVESVRNATPDNSNPGLLPQRTDSLTASTYAVGGMSAPVLSTAPYQEQPLNPSIGAVTAHLYDPDMDTSDGPSFLGNRPIGSPFMGPTFSSPQSQKSVIATTTIQYHTTGPSHSQARQLPPRPDSSTPRPRRSQSSGMLTSQGTAPGDGDRGMIKRSTNTSERSAGDAGGIGDTAPGTSPSQRGVAERRAGQIKLRGTPDLGAAGSRKSLGPPLSQNPDSRTAMTTESGAFSMYPRTMAARSPPKQDNDGFGYSQRSLDNPSSKYGSPGQHMYTQTGMRTMPSYEGSQQGGAKWLEDEEPIHVPQREQASHGYSDTQKQKLQPIVQADPMAMMGMGNGHRNRSMPHGQGLVPPNIQTSRPESSAASRGWMQRGGDSPASAPLSSADSKDKGHSKSRLKNLFHIGRTSDSSGQKKKAGSVADQVARLEGEVLQRPMQQRAIPQGSLANSSDQLSQRSANTNGRSVVTVPEDSFREQRVVSAMEVASRIHVAVPPGHLSIVYPDSPMSRADTLAKSSVESTRASGITSGHAQLVDPDQTSSSSKPVYPMQHQHSGSQHTLQQQHQQQQMAAGSRWVGGDSQGRSDLHAVPSASTTLHSSSGNGGQFQGRMDSKSSGLGHHHQPARPAIPGSKAAGGYSSSNSPPFVPAHMRENVGVDSNGSSPRMYQMQRLAESDTRINERMSGSSGRAYQSRQRSTTRDTDEHSSDHDMLPQIYGQSPIMMEFGFDGTVSSASPPRRHLARQLPSQRMPSVVMEGSEDASESSGGARPRRSRSLKNTITSLRRRLSKSSKSGGGGGGNSDASSPAVEVRTPSVY